MSSSYISAALRKSIEDRARLRCEYCQTQQLIIGMPLEIEHIIPTANGGVTDETILSTAIDENKNAPSTQIIKIYHQKSNRTEESHAQK